MQALPPSRAGPLPRYDIQTRLRQRKGVEEGTGASFTSLLVAPAAKTGLSRSVHVDDVAAGNRLLEDACGQNDRAACLPGLLVNQPVLAPDLSRPAGAQGGLSMNPPYAHCSEKQRLVICDAP